MRGKRWIAGTAVAAVLSALGACGGGSEPVDGQSPAAGTTSAEPTEEASESTEPTEAEEQPGGYGAEELIARMKAAFADAESAHLTMVGGGAQGMSGEGDVSYAGDSSAMRLELQSPQTGGGTMEVRLVDGVVYIAMPPMTPEGKFIKLDTNDPNSPFGDLGGVLSGDPKQAFDAFDAGLKDATYVGEEDVEGEPMDHYVLTVDAKKASDAQGVPVPPGEDEVTYDLWIDGDDLVRRMRFGTGTEGITLTMSDWGKPVSVEAPPASAIIQMPGSMG